MVKIILIIIAFNPLIIPQEDFSQHDFKYFDGLIGEWHTVDFQHYAVETWQKADDSTLTAISYILEDEDTVSYESISLEIRNGEIFYIPSVRNQNNGEPIPFKLTALNDEAVFENRQHDFPQRIIYRIDGDKLEAIIEGDESGEERSIIFNFDRKK